MTLIPTLLHLLAYVGLQREAQRLHPRNDIDTFLRLAALVGALTGTADLSAGGGRLCADRRLQLEFEAKAVQLLTASAPPRRTLLHRLRSLLSTHSVRFAQAGLLFLCLGALAGCSSLATSAKATVSGYCTIPPVARTVNRTIVNAAVAPNAIRVKCAGDDAIGALIGTAIGDAVVTKADEAAAAPLVKKAKTVIAEYCALDDTARAINRATLADVTAPNAIEITCADPSTLAPAEVPDNALSDAAAAASG